MKCFMGRVWGDCTWTGREANWKEHLETEHSDKVFTNDTVDLIWDMSGHLRPLSGYYVFEAFDEMFNFYQIYDKERVLWTMTCTSTVRDKKYNFAYEVEMMHKDNEALAITQKFPVHSEYDQDILAEGTCVSVPLTDLARFITDHKVNFFWSRQFVLNHLIFYRFYTIKCACDKLSQLESVQLPNLIKNRVHPTPLIFNKQILKVLI